MYLLNWLGLTIFLSLVNIISSLVNLIGLTSIKNIGLIK